MNAVQASELKVFDGRDNRKELIILLEKLGSNEKRASFIESVIPARFKGVPGFPMKVTGHCDAVAAYFMLLNICGVLGASINDVVSQLERQIKLKDKGAVILA